MKLTKSWLENYITIPDNINELCDNLTMAGLEVDDISSIKDDYVIDLDLTPNRSDCLSVFGISRELNCIDKKYKYKNSENNKKINSTCENTEIQFNILEKNICPKYGYMLLKNVSVSNKTPKYIEQRLNNIGIKLVHPIVDILNYLTIDIGQPMHAYDADKIKGDVSVRLSKDKESFKALDGNEYKLDKENIVISDTDKIISLAGIIGSEDSSVTKNTKNIIVESAFFVPSFMANKARLLKLQTESSHRFERGVDYDLPEEALIKFSNILHDNKICNFSDINFIKNKELLPKSEEVKIDFDKIRKTIGIDIKNSEIEKLLISIGCKYDNKNNSVKNPTFRYDLNIHADYIEEIARLYGYDNIPVISEKISVEPSKEYIPFHVINEVKGYLYKNSYSECINYSFTNDNALENFDWKNKKFDSHFVISNYMSFEQNKLRSNIMSSLIKNIEYNNNVNPENSYRFFEISNVYGENTDQILSCVACGDKYDENWASKNQKFDKYDMTTLVEDIAKLFGLNKENLDYTINDIFDKKKQYIIMSLSINNLIDKIKNNTKEKFINYSKLPYIRRDLSFLIDVSIRYEDILKLIEEINVHSLKKILLFDLYMGKNIPKEKKSLGMGFIFQDEEKTLTHEEADHYIVNILKELESKFKIELRK